MATQTLHEVDADNLTLTTTAEGADGKEYTMTVKWSTPEEMFDNVEAAKVRAETKIQTLNAETSTGIEADTVNNIRKLYNGRTHVIALYTSVGGKPWILPRIIVEGKTKVSASLEQRWALGGGWLKVCAVLSFSRRV